MTLLSSLKKVFDTILLNVLLLRALHAVKLPMASSDDSEAWLTMTRIR